MKNSVLHKRYIRPVSSRELETTPKGRGGHVLVVSKFLSRRLPYEEGKFISQQKGIIVKLSSYCLLV